LYTHIKKIWILDATRELKWLKVKGRRAYNRRKLGKHFQVDLKRLFRQLLAAAVAAATGGGGCRKTYLQSKVHNESQCWTELYKYVKQHKGIRENISAIKDCNGRINTDSVFKANSLNSCCASVFSCE
jgi:hypothetical protein